MTDRFPYRKLELCRMADLNKMPRSERSAAMRGGTVAWGSYGSAIEHVRYAIPVNPKSRRRCGCGCNRRATRKGMANGVCLVLACELGIRRWIKTGLLDRAGVR
jgi:hypothetical protein